MLHKIRELIKYKKNHEEIIRDTEKYIDEEYKNTVLLKYNYIPDFIINIYDDKLKDNFQCKNLWVEIDIDHKTEDSKIEDLKHMLSHEWRIVIFSNNGEHRIINPNAWEDIKEARSNLVNNVLYYLE